MRFLSSRPPAFLALALAVLLVADSGVWVVAVRRASLLSSDEGTTKFEEDNTAGGGATSLGGANGEHNDNGMNVSFVAEYPAYVAGSNATAHSLLSIACPRWEDGADRPPLVLSVVMDKSGSMSGDKIRLLKKTTEFLVTRLSDKDKMGVVAYDDMVKEIMPLRSMDDIGKESALGRISEVEAGGMTHMSGGLLKGIEQQVEEAAADEDSEVPVVRAVLLLTDGLANRGITGTAEMQEAMEEAMGESRARVYTFGYGSDHDGDLLAGLAEAGSGDYFFIEEDESLPTAFGSVLGGLMATACQDIEVTLTPQDGSVVLDASSGSLGGSEKLEDGSLRLKIPDMFAEERKDLVVRMSLGAVPEPLESQPLLRASVTYLDTQRHETLQEAAALSSPRPESVPLGSSRSMLVLFHITRLEAADKIKEAKATADEPCIVHPRPIVAMQRPSSFAAAASAIAQPMVQQQQQQQPQQRGALGAAGSSYVMPLPPILPGPRPFPRPPAKCEGLERAREILSEVLKVVKERREEAEAAVSDKDILDGYDNLEATVEAVLESFKDVATYQSSGQYAARAAAGGTASQSVLQAFSVPGAAPQQPAYVQKMAIEAADFVLGTTP